MGLSTWKELSDVKSRLIELTDALIEDGVLTTKEVAYDLLMLAEQINSIEEKHILKVRRNEMRQIFELAEAAEFERTKKHSTCK